MMQEAQSVYKGMLYIGQMKVIILTVETYTSFQTAHTSF